MRSVSPAAFGSAEPCKKLRRGIDGLRMDEKSPATQWEAEIDQLMQKQLVTLNFQQRKKIYDHVQEVLAQQLPTAIDHASPDGRLPHTA